MDPLLLRRIYAEDPDPHDFLPSKGGLTLLKGHPAENPGLCLRVGYRGVKQGDEVFRLL